MNQIKNQKPFSPLRMNLTLHFRVQTQFLAHWLTVSMNGMDCTTLMTMSFGQWCNDNRVTLECVVLPVCEHHFLPDVSAQEIVRTMLFELFAFVKCTNRSIYQIPRSYSFIAAFRPCFLWELRGICLAWRSRSIPVIQSSHSRILWCTEETSALCGFMGLMYRVQCRWEQFIQATRCNPVPPPLARSQRVHVLQIRVVFYNISGKFRCRLEVHLSFSCRSRNSELFQL